MKKLTITKEFKIDAAHKLENNNLSVKKQEEVYGKCCNLHGHNWTLKVTVSGPLNYGMIINFKELKEIVNKEIIDKWDHQYLNEVVCVSVTTCEYLIQRIADILEPILDKKKVKLEKLYLQETEGSYAELEL